MMTAALSPKRTIAATVAGARAIRMSSITFLVLRGAMQEEFEGFKFSMFFTPLCIFKFFRKSCKGSFTNIKYYNIFI
jgi:hypothetical protein